MVHDEGPVGLDTVQVTFDDERVVCDAGIVLVATLAGRLGIEALAQRFVRLRTGRPGARNVGRKVMALIYAMALGADCIDDCDVLRAGRTRRLLGGWIAAPSTLGTFLRAFTFGHVRQLDRVSGIALTCAWKAGAGPGSGRLVVDIDSFIGEVHGYAKQGAAFGYTGKRGYHPMLATRADTGEVLHVRLRKGSAASPRGALRFVDELLARIDRAGATGEKLFRGDSASWNTKLMARLQRAGCQYSISVRRQSSIKDAISSIPRPTGGQMAQPSGVHETGGTPTRPAAPTTPRRSPSPDRTPHKAPERSSTTPATASTGSTTPDPAHQPVTQRGNGGWGLNAVSRASLISGPRCAAPELLVAMAPLLSLHPANVARTVKNRIAFAAFPIIYGLRERVPRYSLHEQARVFRERAEARGLGDVSLYYWYHTIRLGDGLVTPGTHDYRRSLGAFGFDDDMTGMKVLDVGSATGFFAFEFEQRGADVVSVEVPSVAAMDRFPNQEPQQVIAKIAEMTAGQSSYSPEEFETVFRDANLELFYHYFVDGPFRFCHASLGSSVERRYTTVYDIPQTDIASMSFDMVFLGDLLLHTLHPLSALAAIAPLCHGRLIIAQHMPAGLGPRPAALYAGGDAQGHDHSTWWFPNFRCFEQILKKLGFRSVEVVGRSTGVSRPGGVYYDRPVLHAIR